MVRAINSSRKERWRLDSEVLMEFAYALASLWISDPAARDSGPRATSTIDPLHPEVIGAVSRFDFELPRRRTKYTGTPLNTINNPGHVVAVR
jgi:hypothetical protein